MHMHRDHLRLFSWCIGLLAAACASMACGQRELLIDFAATNGVIRPLHGINKGPMVAGGIVDLSAEHRDLAPPLNRLHDCHWPNPDVVDIHAVFPDSAADPARPESYDFRATDEYVRAVHATGAQIVYRLGESIEHTTFKRFVHPPKDPAKWAQVCLGIVRHYNEGWANGMKLGIRYWEIWNEPENRPAMWTGTDEQFLDLYRVAATVLKKHDGGLKIGGPSFGFTGHFAGQRFQPSAFVTNFLARCRRDGLPLDFFSWHCYAANSTEMVDRARAIRALLDSYGFGSTESHLNEWNYLPQNSWAPLARSTSPETRQKAYEEMSGPAGAAFIAAALIELQDAPLDAANFYHAEVGGFGLFTEHGVPTKNFYALKYFRELLKAPTRVVVRGGISGRIAAVAGLSKDAPEARVLISNFNDRESEHHLVLQNLPWNGPTRVTIHSVDAQGSATVVSHDTAKPRLTITLPAPGVGFLTLAPAPAPGRSATDSTSNQ